MSILDSSGQVEDHFKSGEDFFFTSFQFWLRRIFGYRSIAIYYRSSQLQTILALPKNIRVSSIIVSVHFSLDSQLTIVAVNRQKSKFEFTMPTISELRNEVLAKGLNQLPPP